jgi:hypothetical protein
MSGVTMRVYFTVSQALARLLVNLIFAIKDRTPALANEALHRGGTDKRFDQR